MNLGDEGSGVEEEEDILYDKNLKKGDENYKLFTLRENSILDFNSLINL